MRPPGGAPGSSGSNRSYSRQELQQKPVAKNDEGRDWNKEQKDESQNASAREENNIRSHDSGNGSAGAECRNGRVEIEDDVGDVRADAAGEIKKQVQGVAEVVLDVVSENPQKQHIACDVGETHVEKHARNQRKERGLNADVAARQESTHVGRDGGVGDDKSLVLMGRQRKLVEEYDHVHENEQRVDDRMGSPRIQVFKRDKHGVESSCLSREGGAIAAPFALKPLDLA